MRKLKQTEKMILAINENNTDNLYRCDEHGLFMNRNGSACPYCKQECRKYDPEIDK